MLVKDLTYQIKVGIIVIIGAFLAFFAYRSLLNVNRPSGYSVTVEFQNARGIGKGTSVQRAGTDVGWVSEIHLDSTRGVAVSTVRIAPGVTFPADANFYIMSEGLIEEKYLSIKDNPKPDPLLGDAQPDAKFQGIPDPGLTDMIQNANTALSKVNSLLTKADDFLSDEKFGGKINELTKNLNDTIIVANSMVSRADRLLAANDKNINGAISNAYLISKDVSAMTGDMRKVMGDLDLGNRVDTMLTQVDTLLKQVNQVSSDIGQISGDPDVRANVKDSIALTKTTLAEAQETLRTMRGTLDRVNEKLDKIGPVNFKGNVNIRNESVHANSGSDQAYVDVKTRLRVGQNAFDLGVENIGNETPESVGVNAQAGRYVSESMLLRGGIYRSEFGLGVDFLPGKGVNLSGELYDINDPKLNSYLKYPLGDKYGLLVGVEDIGDANQVDAGISLTF
jgi:phospholipid/cholesterol/gamma-HCH transport system substrate-binding protein